MQTRLFFGLFFFIVFVVVGFAAAQIGADAQDEGDAPLIELVPGSDVTAQVTVLESGLWRVNYVFSKAQTALAFRRSVGNYRGGTWTPADSTKLLVREGGADIIRFASPSLSAEFDVRPHKDVLPRDWTPFVRFSNGEGAIFLDQFRLDSLDKGGEALRLGIRLIADKNIIIDSESFQQSVELVLEEGNQPYAFVGDLTFAEGTSYIGIVDPGLPASVRDTFDDDLAAVFAAYEDRWGFELATRAMTYFAFGGDDEEGVWLSGSTANANTLMLEIGGAGVATPDKGLRQRTIAFFGHEVGHLFQAKLDPSIGSNRHAWWHEGSADYMANRILGDLKIADDAFLLKNYRRGIDQCGLAIEERALTGRGGRVPYKCGDLIALVADASLPDQTIYDIWQGVSAMSSKASDEQEIDQMFLQTLGELGASPDVTAALKSIIQDKQENGRVAILQAMEAAGIGYTLDRYGSLASITLP